MNKVKIQICFLFLYMDKEQAWQEISKELGLVVKDDSLNLQMLSARINDLINNDFPKLVSILYRMDVSEARLKQLLNENPGIDAGVIIAGLMIERQEQKIRSRQAHKPGENISDDEKW
jgi:hypothetical protein